jgi:hypothetical protein
LVTVIAEQGIVGAVLLVSFLFQLARESLTARHRRDAWSGWSILAATLVLPIFVYSQFEGRFLQEPYLWIVLGALYSARMLSQRDARAAVQLERPRARGIEAA